MKRRLKEKERENIEEHFNGDVLFELVADTTCHCNAHQLCLSPEEGLVELAEALDRLKEDTEQAPYLCQTAWDTMAYEIRRTTPQCPADEVDNCVLMLLTLLVVCLCLVDAPACRTLTLGLLMELEGRTTGDQRRQEARQWISTLVWRKGEERLKARMEAYWRSEAFLSEEIGEVLAAGRRAEAADDSQRQPAVASYVINTGGGAAIMGGTFGGVEFNANKLGQLDYERK